MQPFIDPAFANYSKGNNTQLQFIFEAVIPTEHFPHGVKTTYRAYSSDLVVKILENESSPCCFEAINEETTVFPESYTRSDGTIQPEGMFILQNIPNENVVIQPMGFIENSRELLISISNKIHKELFKYNQKRAQDWIEFVEKIAPQTNDVTTYLESNRLHVPLRHILFSDSAVDTNCILPVKSKNSLQSIKTVPTVRWSGSKQHTSEYGIQRTRTSKKNIASQISNSNAIDEINSNLTNNENEASNDQRNEEISSQIENLGMEQENNDSSAMTNKAPARKNSKKRCLSRTSPVPIPPTPTLNTYNVEVEQEVNDCVDDDAHDEERVNNTVNETSSRKRKNRPPKSKDFSMGELILNL